ncbi:MAG: dihydrolipoamide acetyltransferase family protein [Campylobacterales bacterium]
MSVFKMPSLGADMESAVLMEWKVKAGDKVDKNDVIAEVETSKGVIEIEVFETGTVDTLLGEPGTEYAVGTPLALIRTENETAEQLQAALAELSGGAPAAAAPREQKPKPAQAKPEPAETRRAEISPAARKRAQELGVDLDALAAATAGKIGLDAVEAAAKPKKHEGIRPEGMRDAIAKAMGRSNAEIPHYYLSTPINMTPALEWLEAQNEQRSIKERILPAALLIRAVVKALAAVPELNGFWKENTLKMSAAVHPGIAVALRSGGLITPALIDANTMDLDQTMAALHDLITRTRSGKLRSSEMTQQTIVITNLGDLGVERVYGVIYPPQVALVGFGQIADAPWAEGGTLTVKKVMQATLAGDHRATDGRIGAFFLTRLNQLLQTPEELL